jgi:hypothetical protein
MSSRQAHAVLTRTDLIHDFALKLEARAREAGAADVEVYVLDREIAERAAGPALCRSRRRSDPVPYAWFRPDPWVLPVRTRAAEERIPVWWPPLTLQRSAAGS